jgi:NADH-quinone oxidoreductase subunit L/multicomponent Na+:H+ antiporter subunit D
VIGVLCVAYLAGVVLNGGEYTLNVVDFPFFALKFRADMFSIYMALSMTFLWVLTDIYSFGYMAHEHAQTRYYAALTINLSAAMGIVFASNLVTFFIFFEMLTLCVYPLVIHEETEEAYRAGIMYGAYLLTGGALVLTGIIIVQNLTGTINFVPGGIPALASQSKFMLSVLFVLFIFGFGFKAGLVPLHTWLPEAMIAPTPISAVLHAVAVVNVGVFGLIRIIYNVFGAQLFQQMGFGYILAVLASITIIYAAIMGLRQKEIKRMLAMSTINQLSFMIIGVASMPYISKLGGLLHIYFHAFMKITLFYCAGAIITQSKNKYVTKMSGLAKRMPITMTCFAITAVGIIGLPPVAGWVSKWYMMKGYFTQGEVIFPLVLILSGIIELGFFAPPIMAAFLKEEEPGAFNFEQDTSRLGSEAPWTMWLPIIIVAVFSLIFGLWGFIPHKLAQPALTGLLGQCL